MPSVSLKDVRAELEEAYSVKREVDQAAAANAAPSDPPNDPAPKADAPSQNPPQGDSTQPPPPLPPNASAQEVQDWEKKAKEIERRFKAIQSAITPTQQENARLRKELDDLRAKVTSLTPAEQTDMKLALEKAREVLPEAVAPIEMAMSRVEQLEQAAKDREEAEAKRTVDSAMARIFEVHPDADKIAKTDEGFWKHVDSFEESATYRLILEQPWNYKNGTEIVNDLFSTYKEAIAAPKPPSSNVPRPDVAPPVRGVPSSAEAPAPSAPESAPMTDKTIQRLDRKIRSASREDLLEIRAGIVKMAREQAEARR